jgi:hypothetical protein
MMMPFSRDSEGWREVQVLLWYMNGVLFPLSPRLSFFSSLPLLSMLSDLLLCSSLSPSQDGLQLPFVLIVSYKHTSCYLLPCVGIVTMAVSLTADLDKLTSLWALIF